MRWKIGNKERKVKIMKAVVRKAVNEFRKAFQSGIEGIVKASEIYVDALDADPKNADVFRKEFADWIPSSSWAQFEAVGRKWIHPRLIMGGMSNSKKSTRIKRLPYSMQERVFAREQFPLLVSDRKIIDIDMMEATPEQVEQLCNGSEIRSIKEQRIWIQSQSSVRSVRYKRKPYRIIDGKVVFRRGATLTSGEIVTLLQEIK